MSILDGLTITNEIFYLDGRPIETGSEMQLKTRWSWLEVTMRVERRPEDNGLNLLALHVFDGVEFIHKIDCLDEIRWR